MPEPCFLVASLRVSRDDLRAFMSGLEGYLVNEKGPYDGQIQLGDGVIWVAWENDSPERWWEWGQGENADPEYRELLVDLEKALGAAPQTYVLVDVSKDYGHPELPSARLALDFMRKFDLRWHPAVIRIGLGGKDEEVDQSVWRIDEIERFYNVNHRLPNLMGPVEKS